MDLSDVDPAFVIEALAPLLLPERRARIDEAVASRLGGLRVALENLHDPHNGAAVLRSSEAFGVQRVDVIEASEPFRFSPTVTQGCERWLDVVRHPSFETFRAAAKAEGFVTLAAVPGEVKTLEDFDPTRDTVLLFGNEHDGLSSEALAAADASFGIPMAGMTQSLNLSVAAAIATQIAAARRRVALGRSGDLHEAVKVRLRARWYFEDVRGADLVVARALAQRAGAVSSPTMGFRIGSGVMAAYFVFAAVVQWNDPDPVRWMAVYGVAALLSGFVALGRRVSWLPWAPCLAALAWAIVWAAGLDWKNAAFALDRFGMMNAGVEELRELGGLAIVAAWMATLAIMERRRRPAVS